MYRTMQTNDFVSENTTTVKTPQTGYRNFQGKKMTVKRVPVDIMTTSMMGIGDH